MLRPSREKKLEFWQGEHRYMVFPNATCRSSLHGPIRSRLENATGSVFVILIVSLHSMATVEAHFQRVFLEPKVLYKGGESKTRWLHCSAGFSSAHVFMRTGFDIYPTSSQLNLSFVCSLQRLRVRITTATGQFVLDIGRHV